MNLYIQVREMVDVMEERKVPKGSFVIREGELLVSFASVAYLSKNHAKYFFSRMLSSSLNSITFALVKIAHIFCLTIRMCSIYNITILLFN